MTTVNSFYYYTDAGDKTGPVNANQLRTLAKTGKIHSETKIETMEGKKCPARKVQGLVFANETLFPENEPSASGTAKIVLPSDDTKSVGTPPVSPISSTGSAAPPVAEPKQVDLTVDELRRRRQLLDHQIQARELAEAQTEAQTVGEDDSAAGLFGARPLRKIAQLLEFFAGFTILLQFFVVLAAAGLCFCYTAAIPIIIVGALVLMIDLLILRPILLTFAGIGRALNKTVEFQREMLEELHKMNHKN